MLQRTSGIMMLCGIVVRANISISSCVCLLYYFVLCISRIMLYNFTSVFPFHFLHMIVITFVLGQVLAAILYPRTIFGCKTLS